MTEVPLEGTPNPHVTQWLRFVRTMEELARANGLTEDGWDWLRSGICQVK